MNNPAAPGQRAIAVGGILGDPDLHYAGFHFEGAVPPLRVYALQGTDTIVAWAHNRKCNIIDAQSWETPNVEQITTNARIHFDDPTDSTWTVHWWSNTLDLDDSTATYTFNVTAQDGKLTIAPPAAITNDAALIITK